MSGPVEARPPLWMRVLVTVAVEPWGAPVALLVPFVFLLSIAAAVGVVDEVLPRLVVGYLVALGTLMFVRWRQRDLMRRIRERRRSGELYDELLRQRKAR